jgi:asparagine synthase (glutamine-hydrolysing)
MCGIAAIYTYGGTSVDRAELDRITDDMHRRGPDGRGVWVGANGSVGLGHRRLAIIGLGDQGAQPMALAAECNGRRRRTVVTFNGEIYNHHELRARLRERGHTFASACDTEVILHLYEEHGPDLVRELRGMFAFALWDEDERRLLLARDPYGIKPLYYADDGDTLRVASQVRSLLAGDGIRFAPDDAATASYFLLGSVPEPMTYVEGIRSLPAGSWAVADATGLAEPVSYFRTAEVFEPAATADGADATGVIHYALRASVASHLVADVDVGVFLSAGIDSGVLLALSTEVQAPMTAVTLGFEAFRDTANDEVPLAARAAELYSAKHHVSIFDTAAPDWVDAVLDDMDQPSIDGINTWLVSRAAKEAGLKVVLSGVGADELFGGYDTFVTVPRWARRLRAASNIPKAGPASVWALRRLLPKRLSPKAAGILEYGRSIEDVWFLRRGLFMPWELDELLGTERARHVLDRLDVHALTEQARPLPRSPFAQVSTLESAIYMRNQLLRDTDWASMAHSLEVRVPFVDPVLTRTIAPIVEATWQPDRAKDVLATAPAPPLPHATTTRSKTGFSVPMERWMTDHRTDRIWERVPILRDPAAAWSRRWAYAVAARRGLLDAGD